MGLKTILADDDFLNKILPLAVLVKFIWVFILASHFISKKYYGYIHGNATDTVFSLTEEMLHIGYNIMMGLILVYIFHHKGKICIDSKSQDYLFAFGVLMILGNFKKILHILHFDELFVLFDYIDKKQE